MKKEELIHENEKIRRENEILKLKLEQEEVYNSLNRYRLEIRIEELQKHCGKMDGGVSAIGFSVEPTEEYPMEE